MVDSLSLLSPAAIPAPDRAGLFPTESELVAAAGGGKIARTARDGGPMIDPETERAWRRLQKEVKENAPIVLRGWQAQESAFPAGSIPQWFAAASR